MCIKHTRLYACGHNSIYKRSWCGPARRLWEAKGSKTVQCDWGGAYQDDSSNADCRACEARHIQDLSGISLGKPPAPGDFISLPPPEQIENCTPDPDDYGAMGGLHPLSPDQEVRDMSELRNPTEQQRRLRGFLTWAAGTLDQFVARGEKLPSAKWLAAEWMFRNPDADRSLKTTVNYLNGYDEVKSKWAEERNTAVAWLESRVHESIKSTGAPPSLRRLFQDWNKAHPLSKMTPDRFTKLRAASPSLHRNLGAADFPAQDSPMAVEGSSQM